MINLCERATKVLAAVNDLFASKNVLEMGFSPSNEKTKDQIMELAHTTSKYFLDKTSSLVYEDREKLLYSLIDIFTKILGSNTVLNIFHDPISDGDKKEDPKTSGTQNQQIFTQQENAPDVNEIPGLEDLLNHKK